MPQYIIMNQAQSNTVRGQTVLAHACAPVPVPNAQPQTFVLPIEIKDDPYHANIKSLLDAMSVVTTAPVGEHTDKQLMIKCTFDVATWTVGTKIAI